jgi:hypothetical protein
MRKIIRRVRAPGSQPPPKKLEPPREPEKPKKPEIPRRKHPEKPIFFEGKPKDPSPFPRAIIYPPNFQIVQDSAKSLAVPNILSKLQ